MGVKTLVAWDWDGTVVDSKPVVIAALQDTAAEFHQPPITMADVSNVMNVHRGSFWTDHFGLDFEAQFNYFLTRFEYHTAQKELHLFEESLEVMRWLKSHNVPQMVISNKPQYLLDDECDRLGLHSYFIRVIGTELNDDDKKPNISFGVNALQDLFFDDLVIIGDGSTDMEFARNLQAVAVYVQNPPLPNVPYDYHVPHDELMSFVQSYFARDRT